MTDNYITASEIGEFLYCQRSWWYRKRGEQSAQIAAIERGTEQHEQLAQDVVQTERGNRLAWQLILVGIVLFILFLILRGLG
jgi:CRISPR/Cas system-associated exonuclease Cas4 (RecB family)